MISFLLYVIKYLVFGFLVHHIYIRTADLIFEKALNKIKVKTDSKIEYYNKLTLSTKMFRTIFWPICLGYLVCAVIVYLFCFLVSFLSQIEMPYLSRIDKINVYIEKRLFDKNVS